MKSKTISLKKTFVLIMVLILGMVFSQSVVTVFAGDSGNLKPVILSDDSFTEEESDVKQIKPSFDGVRLEHIKITPKPDNGGDSPGHRKINLLVTENWTGYEDGSYLFMRMNNIGTADLAFQMIVITDTFQMCFFKNNPDVTKAELLDSDGKSFSPRRAAISGTNLLIPKGFDGYIKLSLNDVYNGYGDLDFTKMWLFHIPFLVDRPLGEFDLILGEAFINKSADVADKEFIAFNGSVSRVMPDGGSLTTEFIDVSFVEKWTPSDDDFELSILKRSRTPGKESRLQKWYWKLWEAGKISDSVDLTRYNGISFEIDNTKQTPNYTLPLHARINVLDGSGGISQVWETYDGSIAQYYTEAGSMFYDSANLIPRNFKGTVIVSFNEFMQASGTPGTQDLSNAANKIYFYIDATTIDLGSIKFKMSEFKFVENAENIERNIQETITYGDTDVVFNMDYKNQTDFAGYWYSRWDSSAMYNANLVKTQAQFAGSVNSAGVPVPLNGMEVNFGRQRPDVPSPSNDAVIQAPFTKEMGDINGKEGLTFFIKNTCGFQTGFRIEFNLNPNESFASHDSSGQRWQIKRNARYTLYNTKTGQESVMTSQSWTIYVPADFEGYLRISFDEFQIPQWEQDTTTFSVARERGIKGIYIVGDTLKVYDTSFIISNIGWYGCKTDITTTFFSPINSFVKAMTMGW